MVVDKWGNVLCFVYERGKKIQHFLLQIGCGFIDSAINSRYSARLCAYTHRARGYIIPNLFDVAIKRSNLLTYPPNAFLSI